MNLEQARLEYQNLDSELKADADKISLGIWKRNRIPELYIGLEIPKDWYGDDRSLEVILTYVQHLEQNYQQGVGLHLYGDYGTGKTFLMCHVLKEATRSYAPYFEPLYSGYFIPFAELLNLFTDGWYDRGKREKMEWLLQKVDFLAIDDLGKEFKSKSSNLNMAALDMVLRNRIYAKKPILITTNRQMGEIEEDYGKGIRSLLNEACLTLLVEGGDYRTRIAENR